MFEQANGNTFTGCHSRDNAVGVKIEGTGTGNSNGNVWQGGNIEASIASSIGIDLGEADRNRFSGRMEVSATSGIHVRVNPPGSTLAQENVFDLECTGTSTGYQLGDGSGSSQVKGTIIRGGKVGAAITVNSDCIQTRIEVSPSGFAGVTLTDNGYGTILHADVGGLNSKNAVREMMSKAHSVVPPFEAIEKAGDPTVKRVSVGQSTFALTTNTNDVVTDNTTIAKIREHVKNQAAGELVIIVTNQKLFLTLSLSEFEWFHSDYLMPQLTEKSPIYSQAARDYVQAQLLPTEKTRKFRENFGQEKNDFNKVMLQTIRDVAVLKNKKIGWNDIMTNQAKIDYNDSIWTILDYPGLDESSLTGKIPATKCLREKGIQKISLVVTDWPDRAMSVSDAQGLAAFEDSTTGPSALLPRNQKDLSKICQGQVHFSRAKRALIEEVLAYSPSIAKF
jgi:hypothetical protein